MLSENDASTPRSGLAILLALIVSGVVIASLLVVIPGPNSDLSSFYSNWTVNVSVMVATSLSILSTKAAYRTCLILVKSNARSNDYNKTIQNRPDKPKNHFYNCLSLSIGLVLWTSAELMWTYFQLGLGIENPFPSWADALWLAGYPFIIYFAYGMTKAISKEGSHDREALVLLSISTGLALVYIFSLTFGVADIISSAQDDIRWLLSRIYPILDTIALIPSLLIIVSLRKSGNRSPYNVHWLLLACSIAIVTIADIGFGYSERIGTSEEEEWLWNLLYTTSYIVMAGALYAYSRILFTYEKQTLSTLQDKYSH